MITFDSAIVDLAWVKKFVAENRLIPTPRRSKSVYTRYRNMMRDESLKEVPNGERGKGWYVWVSTSERKATYIGVAGIGKTSSLFARLYEEVRDESIAFWVNDSNPCSDNTKRQLDKLAYDYNNKYRKQHERSIQKFGTDKILWIHAPDAPVGVLDVIEKKLIWAFWPRGNYPYGGTKNNVQDYEDYEDVTAIGYSEVYEIVAKYCDPIKS